MSVLFLAVITSIILLADLPSSSVWGVVAGAGAIKGGLKPYGSGGSNSGDGDKNRCRNLVPGRKCKTLFGNKRTDCMSYTR